MNQLEIHLSPLIGERGYDITLPKEAEWKQVIDYVQLFLAFSDHAQGQRILVHSNVITLDHEKPFISIYYYTNPGGMDPSCICFLCN